LYLSSGSQVPDASSTFEFISQNSKFKKFTVIKSNFYNSHTWFALYLSSGSQVPDASSWWMILAEKAPQKGSSCRHTHQGTAK
jgi:hypothetical protein